MKTLNIIGIMLIATSCSLLFSILIHLVNSLDALVTILILLVINSIGQGMWYLKD